MKYILIILLAPFATIVLCVILMAIVALSPTIMLYIILNRDKVTEKRKTSNLSNLLERYKAVRGA
jgi:hypothetical protein